MCCPKKESGGRAFVGLLLLSWIAFSPHTLSLSKIDVNMGLPSAGSKKFQPTPPDKGSFPLDHDGELTFQDTAHTHTQTHTHTHTHTHTMHSCLPSHQCPTTRRMQGCHESVLGMPEAEQEQRANVPRGVQEILAVPHGQGAHGKGGVAQARVRRQTHNGNNSNRNSNSNNRNTVHNPCICGNGNKHSNSYCGDKESQVIRSCHQKRAACFQ